MHTDRKIGFAMGILLIGIVAALFFRNEPLLSTKVPGIRRERELNDHLRERDVAVYLNDNVTDEAPEQAQKHQPWTLSDVLQQMDERNKTAPVPVGARPFGAAPKDDIADEELDGYRPQRRRGSAESTFTQSPSASRGMIPGRDTAEPTRRGFAALPPLLPVGPARLDTVKSPQATVVELRGSKDSAVDDTTSNGFQPPENFEEYIVKYGDTLSEIALRMLGSQKKYIEIYNANKDRMASPDRLDVGKPLRIPRLAENERPTY